MTAQIPAIEPNTIRVGDTVKFTKCFADYPASDGWELAYELGGQASQSLDFGTEVTADGDGFAITIPASTTGAWQEGVYWYRGRVSKSGEVFTVAEGTLSVTSTTQAYAERDHVQKVIDALDAMMEKKATKDQQSYAIQGRSISRMTIDEIIRWRNYYRGELKRLERQERLSKGLGTGTTIQTRFNT